MRTIKENTAFQGGKYDGMKFFQLPNKAITFKNREGHYERTGGVTNEGLTVFIWRPAIRETLARHPFQRVL